MKIVAFYAMNCNKCFCQLFLLFFLLNIYLLATARLVVNQAAKTKQKRCFSFEKSKN